MKGIAPLEPTALPGLLTPPPEEEAAAEDEAAGARCEPPPADSAASAAMAGAHVWKALATASKGKSLH